MAMITFAMTLEQAEKIATILRDCPEAQTAFPNDWITLHPGELAAMITEAVAHQKETPSDSVHDFTA